MGTLANIIDALRRIGSPTQRTALERQDAFLSNKAGMGRRREVSRSASGSAEALVATIKAIPESIREFDADEMKEVNRNLAMLGQFFDDFLGQRPGSWGPDDLDAAFSAWSVADNRNDCDDEVVVQVLGAAFGDHCVRTLGMKWVVITDKDGSAAAIRGLKKDIRAFPFHSIRKRIAAREHGFFKSVYITLEQALQDPSAGEVE